MLLPVFVIGFGGGVTSRAILLVTGMFALTSATFCACVLLFVIDFLDSVEASCFFFFAEFSFVGVMERGVIICALLEPSSLIFNQIIFT